MLSSIVDQIERESQCQPFAAVEATIDELPLGNEEKAALWLLAWGLQPQQTRTEIVRETLALLAHVDR